MDSNQSARTRKCFTAAYNAYEKHKGAATEAQFKAAHGEFAELSKSDPFLSDLLVAVYGEIAREYNRKRGVAS